MTPLFLTLIFVEVSDLIFALDSVPAIFAVTNDPFIVFSANIFALLGLRSLYFVLAGLHRRFYLLRYGVALILVFIGCEMLISHWITIPSWLVLGVVITIMVFCMVWSLFKTNQKNAIGKT